MAKIVKYGQSKTKMIVPVDLKKPDKLVLFLN